MRLQFTPAAIADLDGIFDYTLERWGRDQAERYLRDIQRVCEGLASGDLPGRSADHVRKGYRKAASGAHMIYYRSEGETLIVVRILHQRMDIDRHL